MTIHNNVPTLPHIPHEPLLFYLRDHELYYTAFAGPRYNEYAIFVDYHEWRMSSEIPFFSYLKILKAYQSLLQQINNHPVLIIIPTGFLETIRFYNDYFCVWTSFEAYVIDLITKYFPDAHLCPLDQFNSLPSQIASRLLIPSPCLAKTDLGYQCQILQSHSKNN